VERLSKDLKSVFEVEPKPPQKPSFWRNQAKYFLQGFLWWLINVLSLFILPFLFAFLVVTGFLIGALIGLLIAFLFTGFVNWLLSEWLWFPMERMTFWRVLGHGMLAGIALLIVDGLTVWLPIWFSRNNPYVILATFVWGCYIDGRVGKQWRKYGSGAKKKSK